MSIALDTDKKTQQQQRRRHQASLALRLHARPPPEGMFQCKSASRCLIEECQAASKSAFVENKTNISDCVAFHSIADEIRRVFTQSKYQSVKFMCQTVVFQTIDLHNDFNCVHRQR